VRDVDDGHPVAAQSTDQTEQGVDLVISQRRGWFVEGYDSNRAGQGTQDFHQLPLGRRQVGAHAGRVQRLAEAVPLQVGARLGEQGPFVQHPAAPR